MPMRSSHGPRRAPLLPLAGLTSLVFILGLAFAATPAVSSGPDGLWERLAPYARYAHAMVHDPVRDRLVSFGGWDGVRHTNDVRVLNLADPQGWAPFATAGPVPPVRSRHTMVYDSARDRVIVFGGLGQHPSGNDTWALPLGGDPVWTRIEPPGPLPEGRMEHCAIYDPVRDRMLVFGGVSQGGTVWSLALAGEPAWSPLVVAGDVPIVREGSSAIYDPVGDRMLLFGGADNAGYLYNLVWELTLGANPTWSLVPFGPVYPWSRFGHTAIYDAEDHRMVIFGGRDEAGMKNDAWALYLTGVPSWGSLGVVPAAVAARQWHTAAWDVARDRMLVFGGWTPGTPRADVHALDLAGSSGWTTLNVTGETPPPLDRHIAVLDPRRDRMIVFGGAEDAAEPPVWAVPLTGPPRWQVLVAGGSSPGWRVAAAGVYDPVRDRMIVIGGQSAVEAENDAWSLGLGVQPLWTELAPSGTPPSPRIGHTAVYDPAGDRVIVFGGADGGGLRNDAWALSLADPVAWTPLAPSGTPPAPRYLHAAVLDAARNRMLVFGGLRNGVPFANDTWELTLGASPAWSPVPAAGGPPMGRNGPAAVFDAARDRMVVHGGWNGSTALQDVWELGFAGDVPTWWSLSPPWAWPPGRWMHTAVHDPFGDRMLVFGGHDGTAALGDFWSLNWRQVVAVDPPPPARVPEAVAFAAPWPNPASSEVKMSFDLPRASRASLVVHDLAGRRVRVLADAAFAAGHHALAWDRRDANGRAVAGGIYFVSVVAGEARLTRKLVVMP